MGALAGLEPVGERVGAVAEVAFELAQVGQPGKDFLHRKLPSGFVVEDALSFPGEALVDLVASWERLHHEGLVA